MPLLAYTDPLPWQPRKVLVAGTSGAGKTTLAAAVSRAWGLPCVEMDSLHHGPGWQPRLSFAQEVKAFVAQPRWVTEWQYTRVLGTLLSDQADLVLWLDLPKWQVMRQITVRTVRRRVRREVLWNGNVEAPLRTIFTDPEHIIRWAWNNHGYMDGKVRQLLAERGDEVAVVRLRGRRQVDHWLRGASALT